jgi:hypothetical protein
MKGLIKVVRYQLINTGIQNSLVIEYDKLDKLSLCLWILISKKAVTEAITTG